MRRLGLNEIGSIRPPLAPASAAPGFFPAWPSPPPSRSPSPHQSQPNRTLFFLMFPVTPTCRAEVEKRSSPVRDTSNKYSYERVRGASDSRAASRRRLPERGASSASGAASSRPPRPRPPPLRPRRPARRESPSYPVKEPAEYRAAEKGRLTDTKCDPLATHRSHHTAAQAPSNRFWSIPGRPVYRCSFLHISLFIGIYVNRVAASMARALLNRL
jgi:hypothetical protein